MCMSSAPSAPAPEPLPDPNAGKQEEERKKALIDAQRRRGFGDTNLSAGTLGSDAAAAVKRPTLLGAA